MHTLIHSIELQGQEEIACAYMHLEGYVYTTINCLYIHGRALNFVINVAKSP